MNRKVLVLCTGNSCRSQMAEGWIRHYAPDDVDVFSAGIETHGVNPLAVEAMDDAGIDISEQTSDNVSKYAGKQFDYIITVCDNAKENCPYFPGGAKRIHKSFPDPAQATGSDEEIKEAFEEVCDQIQDFAQEFATNELWNE